MLPLSQVRELHRAVEAVRALAEVRLQEMKGTIGESGIPSRPVETDGAEGLPPLSVYDGEGPLAKVVSASGLSRAEALILVAALAPEVDERFNDLYRKLAGRALGEGLTGTVARTLGARSFEGRMAMATLLAPGSTLRRVGLLELEPSPHGELAGTIRAESDLAAWVLGRPPISGRATPDFPATLLRTVHTLDDVVVTGAVARKLDELVARIRHREEVVYDWGFGHRHDDVEGLVALFHGPPGTGKTMTAAAVAKHAGLAAYRVDLSALVSKYIGETEKQLARIFDRSARQRCVLVFDEADAVFGTRTAISDSHDLYANQTVSYLLSRVESHPGIVLLTTNLLSNIDDAFRRRIHVVIEFPTPGVGERVRLWRDVVPPELPLAADLDLHGLAERFSLTGAQIRDATIEAAYRAAADGKIVTNEHLTAGVRRQYEKAGRMFPTSG